MEERRAKERARTAAETALRLAPNSANAHTAMGLFYRYCLKDDRAALAELETARERAPNDGGVLEAVGLLERAQGRIQDALATLKKAADLDPLNAEIWIVLSLTYGGLRQFGDAHLMVDRALAITPDDIDTLAEKRASTRRRAISTQRGDCLLHTHSQRPSGPASSTTS